MPVAVVKLGSSIVATDTGELRLAVVGRICEEIAALHRRGVDVVIVTSGAIARGIHLLDGNHVVVEGIGFVGTKGFCGGFGRGALAPFGEPEIKHFVQVALDEAIKLEQPRVGEGVKL